MIIGWVSGLALKFDKLSYLKEKEKYLGGGWKRKDPGLENNGQKEWNALSHDHSAAFFLKSYLCPRIASEDDEDDDDDETPVLLVSDRLSQLKPPSPPPPLTSAPDDAFRPNSKIYLFFFTLLLFDWFFYYWLTRGEVIQNRRKRSNPRLTNKSRTTSFV